MSAKELCFKIPVIMINEFQEEEKKVYLLEFGSNEEEALAKIKKAISKNNPDKTKYILDIYSYIQNPLGRTIMQTNIYEEFMQFKERRKAK